MRRTLLWLMLWSISSALLGATAWAADRDAARPPKVVFVVGEDEYRTETTLPKFAAEQLVPRGIECHFIFADPAVPNDFPGADALEDADLMFVSVRRRAPTEEQLAAIRQYVEAGGAVMGIRTASHAFDTRGKCPEGHAEWLTFDPDVLGGNYVGHHGNNSPPRVTIEDGAADHPILRGFPAEYQHTWSLYKVNPLASTTKSLLIGHVEGLPSEPVAWTNERAGHGRVFYTSLGHTGDFEQPVFCQMLARAVFWCLDREFPEDSSAAAEWRPMFDGRTLEGWKVTEFGGQGDVHVEDGSLVLDFGSDMTGITWAGEFPEQNYAIELEAMRVNGDDFFCGLTFPFGESPCSLIVGGWGGAVVGLSSINGYDASENETTSYRTFEEGRWYRVRLEVRPDHVDAWIDDTHVVDVNLKGKKVTVRSEVELSRPLGIASWCTTAALRNIRWRPLAE